MTAENISYGKLSFRRIVFIVLLILVGLFLVSLWADRKSAEVEGPSRLVRGPHDTIYVQVDRSIARVSPDGEVLQVLDLDTDACIPDVADFFVEEDGRLLFARRDSQLLQYFSSEGKLLTTFFHVPPHVGENHSYTLTKDPSTGFLYFADRSRNHIQIFGVDGKEVKTITVPSDIPAYSLIGHWRAGSDLERIYSPETPLQYPNGLAFADNRLIATDTGNSRIVVFYPDGQLDRIVAVFPLEASKFINPIRADRFGDTLYVVVRGPGFTGKVESFEFNTGLPRNFRYSGSSDPWDILARRDDVLVADRASLTVIRYAHSGRFLGIFGKSGLQSLYTGSQLKRQAYEWIRKGSLASIAAVFGWLLFTASSRLTARQNVLGPFGSARRKMLLLIPGLGQAVAGRPMRASILLFIFLYFASLFISSWLQYQSQVGSPLLLPVLITAGLTAYSVWIFIVLDGIRLTGKPDDNEDRSVAKHCRQMAFALLITLCCATAAQLAREFIVHGYPEAPPVIQELFYFLITSANGPSSLFAAAIPASILFGWGGATAALFGTFAWQVNAHRSEIATGIVIGFLAGIYSWLFTVVLAGNRLGWMLYVPPIQGILLSLFTYLYFRKKGLPVLIIPAAVAGAWIGYFLKFFFSVLAVPIRKTLSGGDDAGLWTGAIARLELILIPAFFMHIAIWVTWAIASDRPAVNADAVIQQEDGFLVSS